MLLEDYDFTRIAVINPEQFIHPIKNFPTIGVSCFSQKLLDEILQIFEYTIVGYTSGANGKKPICKIKYDGIDIVLFLSRVGGPGCVIDYEEICAMGLEKLLLFGTCGVLDKSIGDLAIILPTSAIRDEGTSYHYIEANDEITVNSDENIEIFENLLKNHKFSYIKGKTWTTDAIYRETPYKVQKRKEQGCICVEMECASMAAVAAFRQRDFFNFFYAADNLDGIEWDRRSLSCHEKLSDKVKIGLLALEMASKM